MIPGRAAVTMDGTWLWHSNNGFGAKPAFRGCRTPMLVRTGKTTTDFCQRLRVLTILPLWAPDVAVAQGQECCHIWITSKL